MTPILGIPFITYSIPSRLIRSAQGNEHELSQKGKDLEAVLQGITARAERVTAELTARYGEIRNSKEVPNQMIDSSRDEIEDEPQANVYTFPATYNLNN
jgi:hypothetical protein